MLNDYFKQGKDFGYKFVILKFLIRILNKFKLGESKLTRYIRNQIDDSIYKL